ncbi:hypothetical protein [Cribrihabitans neustonicus]|uniref:hypothetical protein n=1 Tax=Cribrihabitans neustonicus TaxID=1429085 RepID=UPI003B5C7188
MFYIPGYDPFHPRRYRELYRKECAAQAAVSGYRIAVAGKPGAGGHGWQVAAEIEDAPVEAQVEVLVWSDLVRGSMAASIAGTYLQLARTAWIYISTGTLRQLMRLRKGPVIAALYPLAMLLAQALLALLLAWGVARGTGALAALGGAGGGIVTAAGWALGLAGGYALLRWFKARDGVLFAYYLMHDYAHTAAARGAYPEDLQTRLGEFRAAITAALEDPELDEVLVVGHSSGAHLGVSVLAGMLRAGLPADRPALGFLTLGQVVPMVSFLPGAAQLRADLRLLSQNAEIAWVDVTAPGDGCAFALCDPVAVSGVATDAKRWPLVISAAFTQTLSPARWKALRWRFFRLHFQYLCAFDQPGDYDYFRITAGPQTLAARFRGRQPSKSRIDVPVSKFTSVTAEVAAE